MAPSAGDRLGPYRIVGPLGAGGMGEVYRAKDTRLGREVAIKVLQRPWHAVHRGALLGQRIPEGDFRLLHALAGLAQFDGRAGRAEQAERGFRRALELGDRGLGATHPDVVEVRRRFAAFLCVRGRSSELVSRTLGEDPAGRVSEAIVRPSFLASGHEGGRNGRQENASTDGGPLG